jgi:hypothetical protein
MFFSAIKNYFFIGSRINALQIKIQSCNFYYSGPPARWGPWARAPSAHRVNMELDMHLQGTLIATIVVPIILLNEPVVFPRARWAGPKCTAV